MPLFQPRTYADVMPDVRTAVYAIWAVFWLYWLISAFSAKEDTGARRPRPAGLAVVLLAFVLLRVFNRDQQATPGPALKAAGLILLLLGLGLAVWARVYLGRNWGMPMTERAEPELVTSGPLPLRPSSDLLRHPAGHHWHSLRPESLLVNRPGRPGRLFHLQRPGRGAKSGQILPGYLPGLPVPYQDAHSIRFLGVGIEAAADGRTPPRPPAEGAAGPARPERWRWLAVAGGGWRNVG